MPNITEIEHGKHIIKAGMLDGEWVARAFLKPPSKTKGIVAKGGGSLRTRPSRPCLRS